MVDITHKQDTLRKAVATAELWTSSPDTVEAIRNGQVPKGDVIEFSRAAGLLAVKNTSSVIPDCQPLPIEHTSIRHEIDGLCVRISVEVHTVYKTGVEVEAMHGASVTALTMYDMLKPIDKAIEIRNIRLESKTGGKSSHAMPEDGDLRCAVLVCSDSVAAGSTEDASGKAIMDRLKPFGIEVSKLQVVPDDSDLIAKTVEKLASEGYDLILTTGGTGLSERDVTPEAVSPLLDREVPGIMEAARSYGQKRTPFAMLSRGVAGFLKGSLVITLPGSPRGSAEYIEALFPQILHLFKVREGGRHG
jgi:molybdenum cofactor biosynthesis protein MoaC